MTLKQYHSIKVKIRKTKQDKFYAFEYDSYYASPRVYYTDNPSDLIGTCTSAFYTRFTRQIIDRDTQQDYVNKLNAVFERLNKNVIFHLETKNVFIHHNR